MYGSYETAAARPLGLEYGGGGYVAAVDGQKVAPAVATSALNADDYVIQGYAVRVEHVNQHQSDGLGSTLRDPRSFEGR